jgi:hypothetical protein
MTPKEKAKEIYQKYCNMNSHCDNAIECALIAVDEIIDSYTKEKSYGYIVSDKIIPYWEQVKQEINKL